MKDITYKLGNINGDLPTKEDSFDNFGGNHKYVVIASKNDESLELTLHSESLIYQGGEPLYHKDIVQRNGGGLCVGGGRLDYSDYFGGIVLRKESSDFGPVHTEIRDTFGALLEKEYGVKYAGNGFEDAEEIIEEMNKNWCSRHDIQL